MMIWRDAGSSKKQESSRKTSISTLLTMPRPLTVWITTKCGKFWKRWDYETSWPASWETYMQVREQQEELDMEQQTGSKLGKEYIKSVYCHPAYLTYMQSTSWEMLGWKKHKLESRLLGEISITSDMQIIPPLWQKVRKTFGESESGEWKSWLKAQHSVNKDHGIWSHHFIRNRWGNNGKQWLTLFCGAPKSLWMVIAGMKLKELAPCEGKLWPT